MTLDYGHNAPGQGLAGGGEMERLGPLVIRIGTTHHEIEAGELIEQPDEAWPLDVQMFRELALVDAITPPDAKKR